jgi:anti-anti-sigma regulatory factor
MTLRIVRDSDGSTTVIRLIGRMQSEHLDELQAQIAGNGPHVVLDLDEVVLVDVDVVRFFNACVSRRIVLLHCPLYIREWMAREVQ